MEIFAKSPLEAVERLDDAIGKGDIVRNSIPCTVKQEMMNREFFVTCPKL